MIDPVRYAWESLNPTAPFPEDHIGRFYGVYVEPAKPIFLSDIVKVIIVPPTTVPYSLSLNSMLLMGDTP